MNSNVVAANYIQSNCAIKYPKAHNFRYKIHENSKCFISQQIKNKNSESLIMQIALKENDLAILNS